MYENRAARPGLQRPSAVIGDKWHGAVCVYFSLFYAQALSIFSLYGLKLEFDSIK